MGILSRFKPKENNKVSNQQGNNYERKYDIKLKYISGITAEALFSGVEQIDLGDGTYKNLEGVNITYFFKKDGSFEGKKYYMEPVFDENGNDITKESYYNIQYTNMPLVKGFFEKEQIDQEPTNYIGMIAYNKDGKPIRDKDRDFERRYKKLRDKRLSEMVSFKEQLEKQTNKPSEINNPSKIPEEGNPEEDLSKYGGCPYPDNRSKHEDNGYSR